MRRAIFVILTFVVISLVFFYPIFKGRVPFPGDLLLGEYAPYNSYNFFGYSPGGYPNKGQDFDVLRLLYPDKEFSIRSFGNLELPLWNPYNFSGNPHIASLQSGSFYPLNIIFFIFPYVTAWTIFIFLQPVLTGIFSFLFARELKLSIKSSIFSGLIFAFSSYSIVWMEYGNIGHSIVWMPFALWMIIKNLKKPSVSKSIAISLSLTLAILAGYIQTTFYVFVFILGFIVFHTLIIDKKDKLKKLSMFSMIFLASVLLSAIQLLPMLELIFQSARTPYSISSFLNLLIPPFHAVTMFVPDFFGNPATRNYWINGTYIERVTYIGVIPLIFIVYAFFKKQNSVFWFFAITAIIVLFLTFDTFIGKIIYSFQIPFISTAVPTRIMFLYSFSVSIIAGFGLDAFIKSQDRKSFLKTIFILGGIYVSIWIAAIIAPIILNSSWVQNLSISRRNLLLPTGIFITAVTALSIGFYAARYKKFIIVFLIILSLMDLFYFFHKITPFAPTEAVYPPTEVLGQLKKMQGINRSWGYGSGYVSTNLQTYEKIFATDGYNALHLKRYGELLSSSRDGKIAISVPRSDPMIAPGYGESDLRENKYRKRLLDILGVKYILNKNESLGNDYSPDYNTFPEEVYKLVWQKTPWQIYENKQALPRVFLASDYVVEKDKNKLIKMIYDEKFDLRNKVILEEYIGPKIDFAKDENAKVEIEAYTPNKITISTSSSENTLLFLSDNYYPGWKVSVDGEFGKIYRADYSFRAVPIKRGTHEVIFSYYPESFDLGFKVSLITFASLILLAILSQLKNLHYVKR